MNQDQDQPSFDPQHVRDLLFARMARHVARPADDLSKLATALRLTGKQFEWSPAAAYAEKAADQLQRAASFVKEADAERVLDELKRFALREPVLFIGGALLLGLGSGRFLRSTAPAQPSTPAAPTTKPTERSQARRLPRSVSRPVSRKSRTEQRTESTTDR